MDRLANLLPSWLTERLGAQDERGVWWIDADTLIRQNGVGAQAVYTAETYGPDHGMSGEHEFASAREVQEFVLREIATA